MPATAGVPPDRDPPVALAETSPGIGRRHRATAWTRFTKRISARRA